MLFESSFTVCTINPWVPLPTERKVHSCGYFLKTRKRMQRRPADWCRELGTQPSRKPTAEPGRCCFYYKPEKSTGCHSSRSKCKGVRSDKKQFWLDRNRWLRLVEGAVTQTKQYQPRLWDQEETKRSSPFWWNSNTVVAGQQGRQLLPHLRHSAASGRTRIREKPHRDECSPKDSRKRRIWPDSGRCSCGITQRSVRAGQSVAGQRVTPPCPAEAAGPVRTWGSWSPRPAGAPGFIQQVSSAPALQRLRHRSCCQPQQQRSYRQKTQLLWD